jgi:hypothetical protein
MATGTARVSSLIREVEAAAKRLRADITKRAGPTAIQKNLERAASELRKLAANAAAQVEKYVGQLRKDLEGRGSSKKSAAKSTARPKRKRRTTRRKKAA